MHQYTHDLDRGASGSRRAWGRRRARPAASRRQKITPLAVQRTAPIALVLYSLIVVWFHQVGHAWLHFPDRPWYKKKVEPSFADLLTTLRRVTWQERFAEVGLDNTRFKNSLALLLDFVSRTG